MKKVVASLALILTLAIPHLGFPSTRPGVEDLMAWAGCTAELVTSDEISLMASMYGITEDGVRKLYIGLKDVEGLTQDHMDIVILHEIGHCLQDQAGTLWNRPNVEVELEADKFAANASCALGRDGKRLLREFWVVIRAMYDYNGDPKHGTLVERIGQGELAPACGYVPPVPPRPIESQS